MLSASNNNSMNSNNNSNSSSSSNLQQSRNQQRRNSSAVEFHELFQFLRKAELEHYYTLMAHNLKVTNVAQLKYVTDSDLQEAGLTKPEMRRLRKFFLRRHPQSAIGKLRQRFAMRHHQRELQQQQHQQYQQHRHLLLHLDHSKFDCQFDIVGPAMSTPTLDENFGVTASVDQTGSLLLESITLGNVLGSGQLAIVHQGVWCPAGDGGHRVQVAVKIVRASQLPPGASIAKFVQEMKNVQKLRHRHLVQLHGVAEDGEDSVVMAMELAPLRSLLECLQEAALRCSFHVGILCELAQQIAEGMSFLENQRVVHGCLAARNILVFGNRRVKIGDCGLGLALQLTQDYYAKNFSLDLKLPTAWCAPECIRRGEFTSSSDAWAFGVTMWEMFSYGFQPFAGMTARQILDCVEGQDDGSNSGCGGLEQPDACPRSHYDLMRQCWRLRPERRPSFRQISANLPKIIPEQLTAITSSQQPGQLQFDSGDTIFVLDKFSSTAWLGICTTGAAGRFDPQLTEQHHISAFHFAHNRSDSETKISRRATLTELYTKEFSQKMEQMRKAAHNRLSALGNVKSNRQSQGRINPDMISNPVDDFRHCGHVGADGRVFGEVSFMSQLGLQATDPTPSSIAGDRQSIATVVDTDSVRSISVSDEMKDIDVDNDVDNDEIKENGTSVGIGASLIDEILQAWPATSLGGDRRAPAPLLMMSAPIRHSADTVSSVSSVSSIAELCAGVRSSTPDQMATTVHPPPTFADSSRPIDRRRRQRAVSASREVDNRRQSCRSRRRNVSASEQGDWEKCRDWLDKCRLLDPEPSTDELPDSNQQNASTASTAATATAACTAEKAELLQCSWNDSDEDEVVNI